MSERYKVIVKRSFGSHWEKESEFEGTLFQCLENLVEKYFHQSKNPELYGPAKELLRKPVNEVR